MATVNKGATSKWEKTRNSLCVDVHKSTKKTSTHSISQLSFNHENCTNELYVAKCEQYTIYICSNSRCSKLLYSCPSLRLQNKIIEKELQTHCIIKLQLCIRRMLSGSFND